MTDMIVDHKIVVAEGTKTGTTISTHADYRSLATAVIGVAIKRCDTLVEARMVADRLSDAIAQNLKDMEEWKK